MSLTAKVQSYQWPTSGQDNVGQGGQWVLFIWSNRPTSPAPTATDRIRIYKAGDPDSSFISSGISFYPSGYVQIGTTSASGQISICLPPVQDTNGLHVGERYEMRLFTSSGTLIGTTSQFAAIPKVDSDADDNGVYSALSTVVNGNASYKGLKDVYSLWSTVWSTDGIRLSDVDKATHEIRTAYQQGASFRNADTSAYNYIEKAMARFSNSGQAVPGLPEALFSPGPKATPPGTTVRTLGATTGGGNGVPPVNTGSTSNVTITVLSGSPQYSTDGGATWTNCNDGMVLGPGSLIRGNGGHAVITYYDGSTVELDTADVASVQSGGTVDATPTIVLQNLQRVWDKLTTIFNGDRGGSGTPAQQSGTRN